MPTANRPPINIGIPMLMGVRRYSFQENDLAKRSLCECVDPLCPVCKGTCTNRADCVLFRVDMEDEAGTAFCYYCAEDAFSSGVFTSEEE
jgi:hypothetical protein